MNGYVSDSWTPEIEEDIENAEPSRRLPGREQGFNHPKQVGDQLFGPPQSHGMVLPWQAFMPRTKIDPEDQGRLNRLITKGLRLRSRIEAAVAEEADMIYSPTDMRSMPAEHQTVTNHLALSLSVGGYGVETFEHITSMGAMFSPNQRRRGRRSKAITGSDED